MFWRDKVCVIVCVREREKYKTREPERSLLEIEKFPWRPPALQKTAVTKSLLLPRGFNLPPERERENERERERKRAREGKRETGKGASLFSLAVFPILTFYSNSFHSYDVDGKSRRKTVSSSPFFIKGRDDKSGLIVESL